MLHLLRTPPSISCFTPYGKETQDEFFHGGKLTMEKTFKDVLRLYNEIINEKVPALELYARAVLISYLLMMLLKKKCVFSMFALGACSFLPRCASFPCSSFPHCPSTHFFCTHLAPLPLLLLLVQIKVRRKGLKSLLQHLSEERELEFVSALREGRLPREENRGMCSKLRAS